MYRPRTTFYEKMATSRAIGKPVMLTASFSDEPSEDYSTGPSISTEPEHDPLWLLPSAERTLEISTPASYQTAVDAVKTLNNTTEIRQPLPPRVPPMSIRRVREALFMLAPNDAGISSLLYGDGHAMYRRAYHKVEQRMVTP